MVKGLLKLIIALFLLQSAWVAAAQYCCHEAGSDVQHFGHHAHHHMSTAQTVADEAGHDAGGKPLPGADSDCSYCHLGTMKSMLAMSVTTPAVTGPPPLPEISPAYPHIVPHPPERPNWLRAA
jgi:hypothetical protein